MADRAADDSGEPVAPDVSLPSHLTLAEFVAIVADADTLLEVQRRARMPREEARVLVNRLDLREELRDNGRWEWR